jgi:hypothetical protein
LREKRTLEMAMFDKLGRSNDAGGFVKQHWLAVGLTAALVAGTGSTALAQGAARDESGAVAVTAGGTQKRGLADDFAESYAELSTFIGTGTFYASGYRDPYVSTALYLKPVYQLGSKYDLTLNARVYVEEEYTAPDNMAARRFYPQDTWLWLAARNLYTAPRSKVRFGGTARLILPTSYESRYANLLAGASVGTAATRGFEFGKPDARGKRWGLNATLTFAYTKNLHSSVLRGNGPGDSTGCMSAAALPVGPAGTGAGGYGPSASAADRCGGPLNTSFMFTSSGSLALSRGHFTLSLMLIVFNSFRYAAPVDAFSSTDVPRGREDVTWGITTLGYQISEHLGAAIGLSSYQPALDARYRYPRFPFFDFTGTNANNYTQAFVNLNGTL